MGLNYVMGKLDPGKRAQSDIDALGKIMSLSKP